MVDVTKVYGAPGTGKTTFLMRQIEDELRQGTEPRDIAFLSFSRAACSVAKTRAADVMSLAGVEDDKLPWFRTFHSAGSVLLGLGDRKVTPKHRTEFARLARMEYDPRLDQTGDRVAGFEEVLSGDKPWGNMLYALDSALVNTRTPLKLWRTLPLNMPGIQAGTDAYIEKWRAYKREHDIYDYADVLHEVLERGLLLPTRVLFVDEFQDLSPLQCAVYKLWAPSHERVVIVGDDDQTIYGFQGATPRFLLDAHSSKTVVLDKSYRLPGSILRYASNMIRRVAERKEKHIQPAREGGAVDFVQTPNPDTLLRMVNPEDTLILARTNAQVRKVENLLIGQGVPFFGVDGPEAGGVWSHRLVALKRIWQSWYDSPDATINYETARVLVKELPSYRKSTGAGYVLHGKKTEFEKLPEKWRGLVTPYADFRTWTRAQLKNGWLHRVPERTELLDALEIEGRQRDAFLNHMRFRSSWPIPLSKGVRVGTIHSSKGREAETVVLLADASAKSLARLQQGNERDAETRVYYVGATRALNRLVIAKPFFAGHSYPLPDYVPQGAA